jgi:glycine dehydrogenase
MNTHTATEHIQLAQAPRTPLSDLEDRAEFVGRHIGTSPEDQSKMLAALGFASRAALMQAVIPEAIRRKLPMRLPGPRPEAEVLAELRHIAGQNRVFKSFIGQGYYGTHTPAVILRNVLENPAWYTAYTPYQPEISQGRLEAIINFQTMVCDLTAMDIANASMLDEASAAAEAMTLCQRVGRSASNTLFVAEDVLPQTLEVLRTRAGALGIAIVVGPPERAPAVMPFAVLLQYPGANGEIGAYRDLVASLHAQEAMVIVAADLLALALLVPPGEWGADVVVGSSQRFGVPMGFGGPHAGYLATRDAFKRNMPGRLVGVTIDAHGDRAFRLALQTREQHIRREKATSNICTAQVLLAVIASMYAVYHGPKGLLRIAKRVHRLTSTLRLGLEELGVEVANPSHFDTLCVLPLSGSKGAHERAARLSINLRPIDALRVGVSVDETTTRADVELLWSIFAEGRPAPDFVAMEACAVDGFPDSLARQSAYLTHPVFNRYHSETEMLRYLRRLADLDIALDRAMIPLGSCTMKLNATSEMLPISWPEFAQIHPYAPVSQVAGYRLLIEQLEAMLCEATGYAAVSLQPNAGSQGEYAGLLIIRAYHRSRGEGHRDVCLIPSSAHGTNPASAQMAGMHVVVIACDAQGNVDVEDLQKKADEHASRLAAIMITYPSTHGVFESEIQRICSIVHDHGGQVYIDGANLNALVGTAAPGEFGGDVSHLNLHKTFCIPHGGGGPGVGPVAVGPHLARFLPNQRSIGYERAPEGVSAVSAAPFGSASILPISWMYIAMMGGEGLLAATESAILAANYIAVRLSPYYPVLYKGQGGLVAHECILDLRPLKETSGISVDDVAKRLIDFGFHAPTMSFPVAGTLMIEPTESESLDELDRFIEAMIAIRAEIAEVESGQTDREDNPLRRAPHTAADVMKQTWSHGYPREKGAYPLPRLRKAKYWPPVGRVDNVYGDRHLVCSCPPLSDYE